MSINERRFVSRATSVLQDDENLHQASIGVILDNVSHLMTKDKMSKDLRGVYDLATRSIPHKACKSEKIDTKGVDIGEEGKDPIAKREKKHGARYERSQGREEDKGEGTSKKRDTTTSAGISSLLQQSADMDAQEIEQERMKHDELLFHMSDLVSGLKDTTLLMNKMVVEQNVNLDEIQQEAGQNIEELEQQKDRMKRETAKMTMSFWTTLYTAAWLIVMFVGTYIVIKIFPKPK